MSNLESTYINPFVTDIENDNYIFYFLHVLINV